MPKMTDLQDPILGVMAATVDDIESARRANGNRINQLTRTDIDKDGIIRGRGFHEEDRAIEGLRFLEEKLQDLEKLAVKNLEAAMKAHPLAAWCKGAKGVGLKQLARLLAVIGDPYINHALDKPRTVAALWAYCGLDVREGAAPKLRRGVKANWSTRAKTRAYLISESCMKQRCAYCRATSKDSDLGQKDVDSQVAYAQVGQNSSSRRDNVDTQCPTAGAGSAAGATQADFATQETAGCTCPKYRKVYDARKARTKITHPEWTDLHRHYDALRKISKEVLKDLWIASRDWHLKEAANDETGGVRQPSPSGK